MFPSVASANTSECPVPQDIASMPPTNVPARGVQFPHAPPAHFLRHSSLLPPRTKTSRVPCSRATTDGSEVAEPSGVPRVVKAPQPFVAFQRLYQTSFVSPRSAMERWFAPQE